MRMTTDTALLQLYARTRDAEAFGELIRRHSDMVYGTALRVTSSDQDAQDVTQACFMDLARKTGAITSVSGWLHCTATHRALDLIRDERTRKKHERGAMREKCEGTGPSWEEVAPYVDEALETLPEDLRAPLVMHFLEGKTQAEVAEQLGVNQSTISRLIGKGTYELRVRLKKMGVVASVAVLVGLLNQSAATAAPPTLTTALGKMALAGVGEAGTGAAAGGGGIAAAAGTGVSVSGNLGVLVSVLIVTGVAVLGYVALKDSEPEAPARPPARPPAAEQVAEPQEGEQTTMTKPNYAKLAKVQREGGKVWIDYAVDVHEHSLSGLSHIYRIADVLRYYGKDVDMDWLMGVSGEAFAYYYSPDGTYLTPFVHSWDSALAALEAYGFEGEWRFEKGADVEPSLRAIRAEIEAGRLVLAPGIKASANGINSRCHWWFIVNGVDVEAREVSLVRTRDRTADFIDLPYGDSRDPREHPRWYGIVRTAAGMDTHYGAGQGADNPLLFVRRAGQAPDPSAVADRAMQRAVRSAREEPVELRGWGGGTYLAGTAALERLLADLKSAKGDGVEEFKRLNPVKGDPFGGVHEELVHLRLLSERRRAAGAFLRRADAHLPEAARPHTNAAAAKYDEVSHLALEAFELRHGPVADHDQIQSMVREETFGDDVPEWAAFWKRADENLADAEKRKELARLIEGALDAERAAVAEIEKALESLK